MVNLAWRAKSEINRHNTEHNVIPSIDVGDFVLYAKYKRETKLDYTWLGPCVITDVITPMVYCIRPYTMYETQSFDYHIQRLRRFTSKHIRMTEQLRLSVRRD